MLFVVCCNRECLSLLINTCNICASNIFITVADQDIVYRYRVKSSIIDKETER